VKSGVDKISGKSVQELKHDLVEIRVVVRNWWRVRTMTRPALESRVRRIGGAKLVDFIMVSEGQRAWGVRWRAPCALVPASDTPQASPTTLGTNRGLIFIPHVEPPTPAGSPGVQGLRG
jgi:hypothetical protein